MNESCDTAALMWSASEIIQKVRSGAVSASEVVNSYLERIEEINPRLNAISVPLFEGARAAAKAVDIARARGDVLGPLAGLPITVKESFDVAGTPTTLGLLSHTGCNATADGIHVARLRAGGAILIGKTNVSQLLAGNETSNPVYGRTRNPWNPDRAPGGSSGGEAAILAAGGSALGLGSDIGGSVRLPAHACGICALKPTSGRLTMEGHAPLFPGQEAISAQPGPLARHVTDLELALRFLDTPEQGALDPAIPPTTAAPSGAVQMDRLRIAMYVENGILKPAPALRRAVQEAAFHLRTRGASVEEWAPPDMPAAWVMYLGLLMADGMAGTRRRVGRGALDGTIKQMLLAGAFPRWLVAGISAPVFRIFGQQHMARSVRGMGHISADGYWKLVEASRRYRQRFLGELSRFAFDAIICPPDALPAILHGSGQLLSDAISYGALYNLLGMPAGVVPATCVRPDEENDRPSSIDLVERAAVRSERGSAGLPVGVQVAARHWREDIVLSVMSALQEEFRRNREYPSYPPLSM